MGTFNVTYPNGRETIETSNDCETAEQFIQVKFGSAFAEGTVVTVHGAEESKIAADAVDKAEAEQEAETTTTQAKQAPEEAVEVPVAAKHAAKHKK